MKNEDGPKCDALAVVVGSVIYRVGIVVVAFGFTATVVYGVPL